MAGENAHTEKDKIRDMLRPFKDDLPNPAEVAVEIERLLLDSKYGLRGIREYIRDHILEFRGDHDDDNVISEADTISYNVIDNLIDILDENETNYKHIKDYISFYYSYTGFNRLIMDFQGFMSDQERRHLIGKGKRIFVPELTAHWE